MNEVTLLSEVVEPVTTETVETDRPFLTTPFENYTVTEGLLLTIVFLLIVGFIWKEIRRLF